jgi:hypothetical protein
MAEALYKIVDVSTANPVGFYRSREEALARFEVLTRREGGHSLVLVVMDENGWPLESIESPTAQEAERPRS